MTTRPEIQERLAMVKMTGVIGYIKYAVGLSHLAWVKEIL